MNNRLLARFFILSILFFIAAGCAKISAPSGGVRDKFPPVVIKSVPLNGAKNFHGKRLEITFDEYLVLDNINEKFMVSPPMKRKPRVTLKGKSVLVEFDDKLKDSTTYTFYFQDAIRDLNEGNILDNYRFAFSTGPVIDSLSVTGNVYKALDLEAPEKTSVLLYREQADSAVMKHLPDYMSRVDPTSYFRIDNVRAGIYRLYALKDDDNSKNYNTTDESFGFLDSLITVTNNKNFIPVVRDTLLKKIPEKKVIKTAEKKPEKKAEPKIIEPPVLVGQNKLILFTALKKSHYLINSTRNTKYKLLYALSLPPDTMKFNFSIPGVSRDKYLIEPSRFRDTLVVWLVDSLLYSKQQINTLVKFPYTDSLGVLGYKEDSIKMNFLAPRPSKNAKPKKTKLVLDNNIFGGELKPGQKVVFKSQTPLREPDTTKTRLYELVEKNRLRVPFRLSRDSANSGKILLNANWVIGKKYLFIAEYGTFKNIYNDVADSSGVRFSFRDPESYSKLILSIHKCEGKCILQMLDNNDKLIASAKISKDGKVEFPLLDPGKYRLRVIFDLNGDGKWTTGDFSVHRQPEPASYFNKEVEIKSGWVDNEDWDISLKNYKDQKFREKPKPK